MRVEGSIHPSSTIFFSILELLLLYNHTKGK